MTKKPPLSRPATSAIAAFLVLSAPSALAQSAPVSEPAPPIVMVPPVAPTSTPAPAPMTSAPVVAPAPTSAPVIRVPQDVAPEPAAEASPPPAATAAARPSSRVAARAAPVERRAAPVAAATPSATEALPDDANTLTETEVAPIAPVVDRAATPVPVESAASNGGFPWEIAGGAAALLLLGGTSLAFARRRRALRDANNWDYGEASEDSEWVPAAPAAPMVAREVDPAVNPEPARRSTPAFAAAPSGSMGRHEAMALVGPTADNPFQTLTKRLKRARFLDRKERLAYDETLASQPKVARTPVSAWDIAQRPAPSPAAEQEVRRPQPVARGLSHAFRRPDLARD